MIFSLKNGENFYQWDKGRVLIVHDENVDQVHFENNAVTEAIEMDVYEAGGVRMVNVPDELLQCACRLTAFAYKCEGNREYTRIREEFKVIARKQPGSSLNEGETV